MRVIRLRSVAILYSLILMTRLGLAAGPAMTPPTNDPRPVGKYLFALCTIDSAAPSNCQQVSVLPAVAHKALGLASQGITMSLVGDFTGTTGSSSSYPLQTNGFFYVRGESDSGEPVTQTLVSGPAVRVASHGSIVKYQALGPGTITIGASAQGNASFLAAPSVLLMAQVVPSSKNSADCPVLGPAAPSQHSPLDAKALVSLLGSPNPFVLQAQSSTVLAIYTTRLGPNPAELLAYGVLAAQIGKLSGEPQETLGVEPAAKTFTVELRIPHASALGDLATRIGTLNYSQFTLQDVGRDMVRVSSTTTPDCSTWTAFLNDIKRMSWQVTSVPMSAKLFYLSSSDVASAYSGLSPTTSTSTTPSSSSASGSSGTPASGGTSSTSAISGGTGTSSTPTSSASAPSATTISVSEAAGTTLKIESDTAQCATSGLAAGTTNCGSSSSGASSSSSGTPSSAATPTPASPLQMNSMAVAAGTGEQTPPDLLIFADGTTGDDAQVMERLRVLAQLDLPRPELIITAWVAQNSSTKQEAVAAFSNRVNMLIEEYNLQFEQVIVHGWTTLKHLADGPGGGEYYNRPFVRYVTNLYITDGGAHIPPSGDAQKRSQDYLDKTQSQIIDPYDASYRERKQICPRNRYCLGYTSLFSRNDIKPTLTDLLLTIIAAQDPVAAERAAVRSVEGSQHFRLQSRVDCPGDHCKQLWDSLSLESTLVAPPDRNRDQERPDCAARDEVGILDSLFNHGGARVHLRCFDEAARIFLTTNIDSEPGPSPVGLMRSAIADFLFNYKMSQEYPHEFVPYDLTMSANTLNNALNPLVEAFNRDLMAFQLFVRADLKYYAEKLNSVAGPCCAKRLFGLDKPSFYNDALVTVRTISGQQTSTNTTSQSYLNASLAPSLSSLLSSLASSGASSSSTQSSGSSAGSSSSGAGSGSSGGGGSSGAGGGALITQLLSTGAASGFQAAAALLAQYQTTSAQIGRSLDLTVSPRTLSTASSAELTVTLQADDASGLPVYTGGSANDPAMNTSHVAQHDVTSRVRVDSIKLFELSSFTAIVERSHGRFPLLPPFVELPYIGTFAGIPLGSAKEFHSSTAVLSAYVIPTAADLAYGLRFQHDLLTDSINPARCRLVQAAATPNAPQACIYRPIYALRDIGINQPPLGEFNRQMIRCLEKHTDEDICSFVTFDDANAFANY